MSLLLRASLRYLARHRLQCLLAISGIALGVAMVIAIQLIQAGARDALARAFDSLLGSATHYLVADSGAIDENLLFSLRRSHPDWRPAPLVEGSVSIAGDEPRALRVVGIDPISSAGDAAAPRFDSAALMRTPGAVVTDTRTAAALGLVVGEPFTVTHGTQRSRLTLIAATDALSDDGTPLPGNTLLVDIATAQEMLGRAGLLSRIALSAPSPAVSLQLPPAAGVRVQTAAERRAGSAQLTRAFYTNLDALSLLAVLVGSFLIYNTVSFLVGQREHLFARLRALGASRRAILMLVLGEAALLGIVGGIAGNALGLVLANLLLGPVGVTLGDHYGTAAAGPRAGLAVFGAGMILAVAAALAAAALPAWHAAGTRPARHLHGSRRDPWDYRPATVIGVLGLTTGAALLLVPSRSLALGFAALGSIMLGATLLTPLLLALLLRLVRMLSGTRLPLPERLAVDGTRRSPGPASVAVAALVAATATSIGVGLMVASFRVALVDWLDQLLRADVYVSQNVPEHTPAALDPALRRELLADPRVHTLSSVRRERIATTDGTLRLVAYELPPAARAGFDFIAGNAVAVWRDWDDGDVVIVSEPFAWHHRVTAGATLVLATPSGRRRVRVAGIYRDYGSERGVVAISARNFERWWQDDRVHGVGLYLVPGTDSARLAETMQRRFADSGLTVWSNRTVKDTSLRVFDRTFAITHALTFAAALIAALGVLNTLFALNLAHRREHATLRAVGLRRALLRRHLYAQTLVIWGSACLFAIPLGGVIAWLLIDVINVRSFGWSMPYAIDPVRVAGPCLMALAAALAATLVPAEQAVRLQPARVLRHE